MICRVNILDEAKTHINMTNLKKLMKESYYSPLRFYCKFAFRTKLELCMHQWHGYDELYENLAQWLKETEGKVRSESGLRPDLDSKQAQRDTFKVVNKEIPFCSRGIFEYLNVLPIFVFNANARIS